MLHLVIEAGLTGLKPSQASHFQPFPLTVTPTCLPKDPNVDLLHEFSIRYTMLSLMPLTSGKQFLGNLNLVLKLSGVQRLGFMKIRPNLITLPDG